MDIQDIMWLVFEYGSLMNGFDDLTGEQRTNRHAQALSKDKEIRAAIESYARSQSDRSADDGR
jgi:hypothetical protein